MRSTVQVVRRAGWVILGGGLVFQAGGCADNLLLQAIGFELSNVVSGTVFTFTQTLVENFLDI